MPDLIVQIIIIFLVCGFLYWAWLKLSPLLPVADPFKTIVDVFVAILIGAIVLFYAIIPLLHMIPRLVHL